jgi:serine/threonine protein phosphatase PrpC
MRFAVKSDKGMIREINEDSYNVIAGYSGVPVSFVIADGMGGHNSGEIASKMAVDSVSAQILENPHTLIDEAGILISIKEIMENTNRAVYEKSIGDEATKGMGTTLILAVMLNKKLHIGHVGDSRAYIIRDERIEQLTTDHSFIEELIKNGSISRAEAAVHPRRHVITRAIGCMEEVEVDTYSCNIKDNDVFLLCTDGLSNMLDDEEILSAISGTEDLHQACIKLVDMANECGGEDNVTVILFKNN